MKIVIDIQDDVYRVLKDDIYPIPNTERLALVFKTLVKKGTPLPKGCGRLIDAKALENAMYHEAFEVDSDMQRWDSGNWIRYKMFENAINNAPTIIETDKDGE